MSGADRQPWLTATALDQDLLDQCADNLSCSLEMVCEIELPSGGTIYASDRNKYVGSRFYEALLKFPTIDRTMGEWLSTESEFSTVTLELSNVDGRFNEFVPGGTSFGGWIGKSVVVKLGLRDVASTYRVIFKGRVTDIGGFGRSTKTIKVIARDDNDALNSSFPNAVFEKVTFPNIENDKEGLCIPFILGDWTTSLSSAASIPSFPVNGADLNVYGGTRNNVECVTSINALSYFDTTQVYLKRNENLFLFDSADIVNVSLNKNTFEVKQNGVTLIREGDTDEPYTFNTGDMFAVLVKGPTLSGYQDNIIAQSQHIIDTYLSGLVTYSSSWTIYKNKSTPPQSSISTFKSRVWIKEPQPVLNYIKSLLQQVRLEAFFNSSLELDLSSVHYEDWNDSPTFTLRNWDVVKDSFASAIDEKNIFNRAQAAYNYDPITEENSVLSPFFKNNASIAQTTKTISKQIVFPNLYIQQDVYYQLIEILKLSSAACENVTCSVTWRSILQELGQFVALSVEIGPAIFTSVPARIRAIGYESEGMRLNFMLTCLQMFPFQGWNPGYTGTVSGETASIVQE